MDHQDMTSRSFRDPREQQRLQDAEDQVVSYTSMPELPSVPRQGASLRGLFTQAYSHDEEEFLPKLSNQGPSGTASTSTPKRGGPCGSGESGRGTAEVSRYQSDRSQEGGPVLTLQDLRTMTESFANNMLSILEIEQMAEPLFWKVISSIEQTQQIMLQDFALDDVQVVILAITASTAGLTTVLGILEILQNYQKELPDIVAVLVDSAVAADEAVLNAQKKLLSLGIDDVLCNCPRQRELRLSIQMCLFRGHHRRRELKHAVENVREEMEGRLEERVLREMQSVDRQAEPKGGLFWQSAHRTFDGFPAYDRTLPRKMEVEAQINGCRLESRLGAGSFGTVYCGTNEAENRQEAIKVISKDALQEMDKVIRLWKEICCHHKLYHPNIVRLYGTAQGPSHIFICMEMAGTTSLFRALRLAGNRFSLRGSVMIFGQLASAVAYCHEKHVAHRDLKPENIVLASDKMSIKLCDFGSATPSGKIRGDVVGTMPFIAPEVLCADRRLGYWPNRVDVYASGVILLEMVCGIGKLNEMLNWNMRTAPSPDCHKDLIAFFSNNPTAIEEAPNTVLSKPCPELATVLRETIKVDPTERWTAATLEQCDLLQNEFFLEQLNSETPSRSEDEAEPQWQSEPLDGVDIMGVAPRTPSLPTPGSGSRRRRPHARGGPPTDAPTDQPGPERPEPSEGPPPPDAGLEPAERRSRHSAEVPTTPARRQPGASS